MTQHTYLPYLVAINLTQRCNLNCPHCYLDAQRRAAKLDDELTTQELCTVFLDIAKRAPGTIIVLTGGEPLLRPDIEALVQAGAAAGLHMVLGTNGVLLNESRIKCFLASGLSGVGISLDSVHADQHDAFRGVAGSFEKSCRAVRLCKANGLHVQMHFTITRSNYRKLAPAVDLGRRLGASIVNFFFLVCVGRGAGLFDLSAEMYEQALKEIAWLQQRQEGIMVQTRCAPHFKRILYKNDPDSPFTRATGYDGGGCLAGTHYCRIDPKGEVTPCPYIELSAGNLRERPFWEVWDDSSLFASLRCPALQGRCGACEYAALCGGCRARSLAQDGDLLGEDPSCNYVPRGGQTIPVLEERTAAGTPVIWLPEALDRLQKLPIFLRGFVKHRLEQRARAENAPVTVELMQRHRKEREQELGIRFR